MVTALAHIYYPESVEEFIRKILLSGTYLDHVLINLVRDNFDDPVLSGYPEKILFTASSNKGKDIGGKLMLIARYLAQKKRSKYLLLYHDKKSPQSPMGSMWARNLHRIIEPDNFPYILDIFENNPEIGIIAPAMYIKNEWNQKEMKFDTTNNEMLKQLIGRFNLKLQNYKYVAGTIFWVRSEIYENFFSAYSPVEIVSSLENGNVMDSDAGTLTHSWERLFSWICTAQNKTIYGI